MNEYNFEKPKIKIKFVKIFSDDGNNYLCGRYVNAENFYVIRFIKNNGEFKCDEKSYGKVEYNNGNNEFADYFIYNAKKIKFHGINNFTKIVNVCYHMSNTYTRYKFYNVNYANKFIKKIIDNFDDEYVYSRYEPKLKIYCFYEINKEKYSKLIDENVKNTNINFGKNEFCTSKYTHAEYIKTFGMIDYNAKIENNIKFISDEIIVDYTTDISILTQN